MIELTQRSFIYHWQSHRTELLKSGVDQSSVLLVTKQATTNKFRQRIIQQNFNMAGTRRHSAPHNNGPDLEGLTVLTGSEKASSRNLEIHMPPFVGRLGGNGTALSRCSSNEALLEKVPDAAPLMSLGDIFNLNPFLTIGLWKSALMEGVGKKNDIAL